MHVNAESIELEFSADDELNPEPATQQATERQEMNNEVTFSSEQLMQDDCLAIAGHHQRYNLPRPKSKAFGVGLYQLFPGSYLSQL